ncbi:MAG: response regulator [Acidimicrobiia bacterium]
MSKKDKIPKNILVVEDDVSLNNSYVKFLVAEGYIVDSAKNGEEALAIFDAKKPDLILLDLSMPVLDGVGFLEKADILKVSPGTKVIVFTNSEDDDRIDQAFDHGATRYLLKVMLAPKELARILNEELNNN